MMKCYVDQSGKVENSSKLTIVAFANGKTKTLLISAREKRKLISVLREIEYPGKTFIYRIFAALIFLLVRKEKIQELFIDDEYPSYAPLIKDILIKLFGKFKLKTPHIDFGLIGKNNLAHKTALETFRGLRKIDILVKTEDVLTLFYKK